MFINGDKMEMVNYRPMSLTSHISKVMATVLKVRIVRFLNKHAIISKNQFGLIEKSIEGKIYALISVIYKTIDKKEATLAVFINLSKGFVTVFCDKLTKNGVLRIQGKCI